MDNNVNNLEPIHKILTPIYANNIKKNIAEKIILEMPKKSEFISCIRITTSSLAYICGLDIEKIEDMKVIVSEVCIFFINNIDEDKEPFLIEYFLENDKIKVEITDKNSKKLSENLTLDNEMFILIIDSLADKYNIDYSKNKIIFETKIN